MPRHQIVGGEVGRGAALVAAAGCGACHSIPGIVGADGIVGPDLAGLAERPLLGGAIPNRPGALIAFIRNAPRLLPATAMPAFDFNEAEARDIAAFLYDAGQ